MADIDGRDMDKTQVIPEATEPDGEKTGLGSTGARRGLRLFGCEVPTLAVGVVAGALILGLGAGAILPRVSSSAPIDEGVSAVAAPEQPTASTAGATTDESAALTLNVTADNYVAGESSPVIVHVTNADGTVDFYHAFEANSDEAVELDDGTYELSYISPVNPDGSIYHTVEAAKSVNVTEGDVTTSTTLEFVPATEVAADELTQLAKDVAEAVKRGDETLTGESGAGVVSKVDENIKKNPSANVAEVEEQTASASESAKSGTSAATGATSADKKAADNSSSVSSGSATATESSEAAQGGSSSGNGGSSSDTCHHVKVAVEEPTYEQRWVQDSAGYYTTEVVTDAYDEPVYGEQNYFVCSDCKATFWSESEIEDHIMGVHDFEASYAVRTKTVQTGTTHHDAVTRQVWHEATGHYETVQTGTKVVGYRCSVCGASL